LNTRECAHREEPLCYTRWHLAVFKDPLFYLRETRRPFVRRYDSRHDRNARLRSRVFQHTVRVGRSNMFLCHVFADHEVSPRVLF